jgi:hypothetical protein
MPPHIRLSVYRACVHTVFVNQFNRDEMVGMGDGMGTLGNMAAFIKKVRPLKMAHFGEN